MYKIEYYSAFKMEEKYAPFDNNMDGFREPWADLNKPGNKDIVYGFYLVYGS